MIPQGASNKNTCYWCKHLEKAFEGGKWPYKCHRSEIPLLLSMEHVDGSRKTIPCPNFEHKPIIGVNAVLRHIDNSSDYYLPE